MAHVDLSSDENYEPESLLTHQPTATRRTLFWTAWGLFCGLVSMWAFATVRYLVPRVSYEPSSLFKAGRPEDYPMGTVTLISSRKVWIVREKEGIYALIAECTHLSCQPRWLENEQIFKCACHGGIFKKNGVNIAGPPPRPLDRAHISMGNDGRLVVDKGNVVGVDFALQV